MNPKRFLTIAGVILVTMGGLGVIGMLGFISSAGFFNPPYWINWIHLCLGIFVLAVAVWGSAKLRAWTTLVPIVLGLTLGASGLLKIFLGISIIPIPELADPIEMISHFSIGFLGLWSWRNR